MSFRLYESAWVRVDGVEEPVQAHKAPNVPGTFVVHGNAYDIDARPVDPSSGAPAILAILSIQAAHEAGLRSRYGEGQG
jgi:hypothetical protein